MGTDSGVNLLEPGDTPAGQPALPVLRRRRDQGRRHPPGAAARLGRYGRAGPPPRRERGAAGDHLDLPGLRAGERVRCARARRGLRLARGRADGARLAGAAGAAASMRATATAPARLPSPATSSSSGRSARACRRRFPNTVLNTIVAEAIDDLAEDLERAIQGGASVNEAIPAVVGGAYRAHSRIVFGGDNYSEEWHAEAERRGLLNLRTTPDALPELISDATVSTFDNYGVLTERELHSRYDVFLEQYSPTSTSRPRRRTTSRARCSCRLRCGTSR